MSDARSPHSELVEFIDACERAGDHYGFGSDEFFASARVSVQNLVEQLEAARTEIGHLRDELVGADMWLERKTIHQEEQADKIAALEEQRRGIRMPDKPQNRLRVVPTTLREANAYIEREHLVA